MSNFNKGDRVRVTNHRSIRYREIGTVESTNGHEVHVLMDSGRTLRGNERFLELFDEPIDLEADHNNGIEKLMRPAEDDEIQNDPLGEQIDLDCIESGGFVFAKVTDQPTDPVNHPQHYGGDTTYEVIKVITAWNLGFDLGNVTKYVARAGKKDPTKELEDLHKARFYINHRINTLEQQ